MNKYQSPRNPIANPEATITGPQYRFALFPNRVLRFEWAEDGHFEDRASTFALHRNFPKPVFRIEDKQDQLEILTPLFHLTYDKQEFSPNGLTVKFFDKSSDWGAEWRYGQADADNLGGTARTLDGVDGRCDVGDGILSRAGYASLDDSHSMLFDDIDDDDEDDGFVAPRRPGKRVDGYLFFYGLDFTGAMESFFAISGYQPNVPRWCLGNWWSRYHAYDDAEYVVLMDKFRENDIPLSVAVLDMDWHWVKEPFVPHTGWTGYSWNTDLFPSPTSFTQELHDRGLKVTLNDHPADGIHGHEDVYDELAHRLRHDTTHRSPIPFDPTSPAFMHAYFNIVHRRLEDTGCDFWWIDWQQGTHSRIPGFDPLWLLNHFQFLDTKRAVPSSLPLIFSRYAGPGSHRYPVGFSGDTVATWASLRFQPEFTATASNIGFGWWSHDIGGHMLGERDDECTTRWVQYAVFSPLLRLHSTSSRWMSKEPWLYRHENTSVMREAMKFRHRLVPYIYSVGATLRRNLTLVQPLYWRHPSRAAAYRFANQYFFGSSLVVSPIVDPRDTRTNLAKTRAWVPPGRHVDISTSVVYDGDRELDMHRSLRSIPVLAPEGSIIPLDQATAPANGCKNPDAFEVLVVVGQDGHFDIVEDPQDDPENNDDDDDNDDDAPTGQRTLSIEYDQAAGKLSFDSGSGKKTWTFRFISTDIPSSTFKIHSKTAGLTTGPCSTVQSGKDTLISLPREAVVENVRVSVELGPDPQLTVHDHTEALGELLLDFQMAFGVKDRVWDLIRADQPTTVKISRLLSLGLDETFFGPVAELLLADSRDY